MLKLRVGNTFAAFRCIFPGRPLVLFSFCNLYFFYILIPLALRYIVHTAITDRTNAVYALQPLDGNTANLNLFSGGKLSKASLHIEMESPVDGQQIMTRHTTWNVSLIHGTYFTNLENSPKFGKKRPKKRKKKE